MFKRIWRSNINDIRWSNTRRNTKCKIAVLSGPSHAEEVSIAIPTVLVLASKYDAVLKLVQDTFMSDKMRIYTSRDVKGVELGGALKTL